VYRPKKRDCYSSIHVNFDDRLHGITTVQVEGEYYDYDSFLKTLCQRRDECDEEQPSCKQHTAPTQPSLGPPAPPEPPAPRPILVPPQGPLQRSTILVLLLCMMMMSDSISALRVTKGSNLLLHH